MFLCQIMWRRSGEGRQTCSGNGGEGKTCSGTRWWATPALAVGGKIAFNPILHYFETSLRWFSTVWCHQGDILYWRPAVNRQPKIPPGWHVNLIADLILKTKNVFHHIAFCHANTFESPKTKRSHKIYFCMFASAGTSPTCFTKFLLSIRNAT